MIYYYTLRIHTSKENYLYLNRLLGVEANAKDGWAYEIIEKEEDDSVNFIEIFFNILKNKEEGLKSVNISYSDIEFWIVYEYDNQCNLEFDSKDLFRIGEKGISLCISCYESS